MISCLSQSILRRPVRRSAHVQAEKAAMIEQCEQEQLATVLVNTATVVRLLCSPAPAVALHQAEAA